MKKIAIVFLTVTLLTGLLLTGMGCKKEAAPAAASGAGATGALTWPRLTNDNVTFSMFIGDLGNLVSSYDYKDNLFTQKIVNETGINLEFISSSPADSVQRLNVLLSTGDYPDIIIRPNSGTYAETLANITFYAKEGIYLALDEYDPLSFKNIKEMFDEYPAVNDVCRGPDGKLYAIPAINDCIHCRYANNQQLYYQPFMLKYVESGKKIPETLDEFTAYLRWVRDTDVNENGNRNDEIPLAFGVNSIRVFIDTFAKCYMPFVYANNHFGLARNGNRVIEQYKEPRFREALAYMAQLYSEKLVYPDSFTQPQQEVQALATADTPIMAVATGSGANNQGTNYYYQARWLPVLKGPYGDQHSYDYGPWLALWACVNITDKCKDPKLALALTDYILDFEVSTTGYLGPQGYGWDWADQGALSLVGTPARYKMIQLYGTAEINYTWNQVHPMNRSYKVRTDEQANDVPNVQKWLQTGDLSLLDTMKSNRSYNEVKNIIQGSARIPYGTPVEQMIPPLPMSDADSRRIGDIDATLSTILDQAMVEFITGMRNINNDAAWNAYLADLDRVGSSEKATIIEKYLK